MSKNVIYLALSVLLLALGFPVEAQQPAKVPRIGVLRGDSSQNPPVETFQQAMRDLGYVEGKNIVIEFRWAEGKYDRLPDLATELVRLKVDVLVTFGIKAALAAKNVTTTIPIVIPSTADPVGSGLVTSLARPGGNITGGAMFSPELGGKRLELLKEAMPRITQTAIFVNPVNASFKPILETMGVTAKSLKLGLQSIEVRGPNEFDGVFATMAKRRVDSIVIHEDTMFTVNAKRIADLATKNRIPSAGATEFAEAGGLIGYGVSFLEVSRHAAVFVDKILKGTKPADIPVEQATKFELVVNSKTAKTLGIKIPNSILVRADKVIE